MREELCGVEIQLCVLADVTIVLHICQSLHVYFTGRVLTYLTRITARANRILLFRTTEAEDVRTFLASLQLEIRIHFSD